MSDQHNSMEQSSQAHNQQSGRKNQANKGRGGFMALRNNVYDAKLDLWHILKPFEYYLVDIIIDKTIKWREKEATISIEDLEARTGQRRDHIYIALKSLEAQKIIIRRKLRNNWIIGLNEDYFGGVLIKKHEDALLARKARIKAVPNPPKIKPEIRSNLDQDSVQLRPKSGLEETEIRSKSDTQEFEIIKKPISLNTLLKDISINKSFKDRETKTENGEIFNLSGKGIRGRRIEDFTDEEVDREIKRQRREAKAMGII